jgi:DNA invertase Pin-like site-specific DNA recombinase
LKAQVIAVDCDGTLSRGVCWTVKEVKEAKPRVGIIRQVNRLYLTNFIVIYTARRDHLLVETLKWLRKNGVSFHAISNNKIPAACYLDDKALRPRAEPRR